MAGLENLENLEDDEKLVKKLINFAKKRACLRGYPVYPSHLHGQEYLSEIQLAVITACRKWQPDGGRNIENYTMLLALQACQALSMRLANSGHKEEGFDIEMLLSREELPTSALTDEDFKILSFVAAHGGVSNAATALTKEGMPVTSGELAEIVADIAWQVRSRDDSDDKR